MRLLLRSPLAARLRLPDGAGSVLLDAVDAAREAFRGRAHSLRVGLAAAEAVRSAARTKADGSFLQFASAVLRGRADNDIEQLGLAVQYVVGPCLGTRPV